MENELTRFMRAVRDVCDEPCEKTREALREVFSIEPATGDCPEPWRGRLGPQATHYLDIPMALALYRDAGAGPDRYAFTEFCPSSDPWLDGLARRLCACRAFLNLSGKKADGAAMDAGIRGAERFMLDWLVCVAGKDRPLQRLLLPEGGDLYAYLAVGARQLLVRTRPLWFARAVVPLREALREAVSGRLESELWARSLRPAGPGPLPFARTLPPEKAAALEAWVDSHPPARSAREAEEDARQLMGLLLPYPSVAWPSQAVLDLPDDVVDDGYRLYRRKTPDVHPDRMLQKALGDGAAKRVLAELMSGQTPATNDPVVRLDNALKKLGWQIASHPDPGQDTVGLADCLRNNEEILLESMLGGRERKGEHSPFAMLRFLLLQLLQAPVVCCGGEDSLREKLFRLGFALGMDTDGLESRLFYPMELPGIDYKSAPELIRAYCLDCFVGGCMGYAMAQWLQRVYAARYRARARAGAVPNTQPGRMTRYWRQRYRGPVARADARNTRDFLDAMLDDGVPPDDALDAVRRAFAGNAAQDVALLQAYSNIRYRAGSMVIDLASDLIQREVAALQAEMQRQQLCRQQDRPMSAGDLDTYRAALGLLEGIPAEELKSRLVAWIRPAYPFTGAQERDEAGQTALLRDLLRRVGEGMAPSRSELMGLAVAWHICTRRRDGDDLRRYREELEEELDALLRECRMAPYRPDDWDEDLASALRRVTA